MFTKLTYVLALCLILSSCGQNSKKEQPSNKEKTTRDGATPIDLIDGNDFAEHLKELNLGVTVEMVEEVKIKSDWFKNL